MKYIISIILTACFLSACGTTTAPNDTITKLANIGLAYAGASGKLKPADQVYVDAAKELLKGGLSRDAINTLVAAAAKQQLAKVNISDDQRTELAGIVTGALAGKFDQNSLLPLARTALQTYAASKVMPPEQSTAVLAAIEVLIPKSV